MELTVFPYTRRDDVETVVRATLAQTSAPSEDLRLVIVRVAASEAWAVAASGLADPVAQRGFIEVLEDALRSVPV